MDEAMLWAARAYIYQQIVATTRPPRVDEISRHFGISASAVGEVLQTLHDKHALFLKPGTQEILLANPFAGVPTGFIVEVDRKHYWANCAWDCFGIVAALHAPEATIRATCAQSKAALTLTVEGGQPRSAREIIHFQVPFRRWYDDLVHT